MIDNFISALGYTILTTCVSYYYFQEGKKRGIQETCMVFNEHEQLAFERLRSKLKEMLNVNPTDAKQ
jgi:hypothetical protein